MRKLSLILMTILSISCVDFNDPKFHPRNEYNEWLANKNPQGNFDDLLVSYDQKRAHSQFRLCSSCHGLNGEGNSEVKAPQIAGLPDWYVFAQLKKFQEGVRGKHPHDEPGLRMAPMARMLKEQDMAHVAHFVSQLPSHIPAKAVQGDAGRGKELYATCVACHGEGAVGNKTLNAPPLKHANDWYLVAQLKNFKQGVRAGDPARDITGATMAPMANTLVDDQAISDVVSYISSIE